MKKIRDFSCQACNKRYEAWVDDEVKTATCINCGGLAVRSLSAPKCFQNTTGKSPSASKLR